MDIAAFITRLLDVIQTDIAPKTRQEVERGNKLFGAAILRKSDLSVVITETNNEVENPLWHGEMHAIKKLYERPRASLPEPKDCIFIATHEPCSLCLSAITWGGYDNFYYLFSHEDSRDSFSIPHDLKILKEVFTLDPGGYNAQNAYWQSHNIAHMIASLDEPGAREGLLERMGKISALYADISAIYQANKGDKGIPLASAAQALASSADSSLSTAHLELQNQKNSVQILQVRLEEGKKSVQILQAQVEELEKIKSVQILQAQFEETRQNEELRKDMNALKMDAEIQLRHSQETGQAKDRELYRLNSIIEENEKVTGNMESVMSQLTFECQKLKAQLAIMEQECAQESSARWL